MYSYTQTDSFGSYSDMSSLDIRNENVRSKGASSIQSNATFVPKPLIDWLKAPDKNFERVVRLSAAGWVGYTFETGPLPVVFENVGGLAGTARAVSPGRSSDAPMS